MKRFGSVALIALFAYLYWNLPQESKSCVGAVPLEGQGEVAGVKGEKQKPLPPLPFETKGKTVLLNLWATWCAPCKLEMPALDELQQKTGDANFEVMAINIDTRNIERAKEFYETAKIKHLKYYADNSADIFQTLKKTNLAFGMPTSLLIDRQGCVVASLAGAAEWASPDAVNLINQLKAQK